MQVLNKRQTGESAVPPALTYGEIAIDKRGCLHTADETGAVVDPLAPATEAISSTQYDVKMLQLQQIVDKKEPPMLGGFIEAFGDTKKRLNAIKCTLDTAAHQLRFNGDNSATQTANFYTPDSGLGTYTNAAVTGVMACPTGAPSVRYVEMSVGFAPPYTARDANKCSVTAYGRQTVSGSGTALTAQIIEVNEYTVTARIDNPGLYPYYAITINNSAGYQYEGASGAGSFASMTTDGAGVYPGVTGAISVYTPATATVNGWYTSKVIDLGVPVEAGELYLHYPALPAGATLTPKLGTAANNHVELTPEGAERTVTIGSQSLRERKYRIPAFAEAVTGVSVRVEGHREQVSDELVLNDICVCMR